MTTVLEYVFEELPLVSIDGFEAGEINGKAEIRYDRSGCWEIGALYLDGSRRRPLTEEEKLLRRLQNMPQPPHITERKPVDLAGHPLFSLVYDALKTRWAFHVQWAVREQLDRDYGDAMEAAR